MFPDLRKAPAAGMPRSVRRYFATATLILVTIGSTALLVDAKDGQMDDLRRAQVIAKSVLAKMQGKEPDWQSLMIALDEATPGGVPDSVRQDATLKGFVNAFLAALKSDADEPESTGDDKPWEASWRTIKGHYDADISMDEYVQSGINNELAGAYETDGKLAESEALWRHNRGQWPDSEYHDHMTTYQLTRLLVKQGKLIEATDEIADYQLRRDFAPSSTRSPSVMYSRIRNGNREANIWSTAVVMSKQEVVQSTHDATIQRRLANMLGYLSHLDDSLPLGPWVVDDESGAAWLDSVAAVWSRQGTPALSPQTVTAVGAFAQNPDHSEMSRAKAYYLIGDVDAAFACLVEQPTLDEDGYRLLSEMAMSTFGHPDVLVPSSSGFTTRVGDRAWADGYRRHVERHDPTGEVAAAWRAAFFAGAEKALDNKYRELTAKWHSQPPAVILDHVRALRHDREYVIAYIAVSDYLQKRRDLTARMHLRAARADAQGDTDGDAENAATDLAALDAAIAQLAAMGDSLDDVSEDSRMRMQYAGHAAAAAQLLAGGQSTDALAAAEAAKGLEPSWMQHREIHDQGTIAQIIWLCHGDLYQQETPSSPAEATARAISLLHEYRLAFPDGSLTDFLGHIGKRPRSVVEWQQMAADFDAALVESDRSVIRQQELQQLISQSKWTEAEALLDANSEDSGLATLRAQYTAIRSLDAVFQVAVEANSEELPSMIASWKAEHMAAITASRITDARIAELAARRVLAMTLERPAAGRSPRPLLSLRTLPQMTPGLLYPAVLSAIHESPDLTPYTDELLRLLVAWPDSDSAHALTDSIMTAAVGDDIDARATWFLSQAERLPDADEARPLLTLHFVRYLYRQKAYDAALDYVSEPADWPADQHDYRLLMLGLCRLQQNDTAGALASLQQLLHDFPDSTHKLQATFLTGWAYILDGDTASARPHLEEVVAKGEGTEVAVKASKILAGLR